MTLHCDSCCDNHKNEYIIQPTAGEGFIMFTCIVTASGDVNNSYKIRGVNNDNCPCECHDLCGCCDCEL